MKFNIKEYLLQKKKEDSSIITGPYLNPLKRDERLFPINIPIMAKDEMTAQLKRGKVMINHKRVLRDAHMIKVVAQKFNLISDFEQLAKADIVKNYKILVLVVGGSSKGLGAAGIDKEQELIRTKSKEMKIPAFMYGMLMKRKY